MKPRNPGLILAGVLALLVANAAGTAVAADPKPFELKDGDRVALIGGTFIEREQAYSQLETVLSARWPDRRIQFRNLGWSGDNVFGASRGYFEGADAGFARLNKIVHELKPSVVLVSYGMTESFDGEAGLPNFRSGLGRMLDMLKDLKARETVLIGPIAHEKLRAPFPEPAEHNKSIRAYADAMKQIAAERGYRFVDLYDVTAGTTTPPLTDNGIHLNAAGYAKAAHAVAEKLGVPVVVSAADAPTLERVREICIRKNVQYFNQWRPANETYIFGFRAHEQGKNSAEMPQFNQPIEQLEAEIAKQLQTLKK